VEKNAKAKNILYYIAVSLLPNIFLFYLFNSNEAQNDLYFLHFLVLALVFAIISIVVFIVFQKITTSHEGALVALVASWILFWLFEPVVAAAIDMFGYIRRVFFGAVAALIITALLLLLRKLGKKLTKGQPIFMALSGIICLLFIFNFGEAFYTDVVTRILVDKKIQLLEHKTDYVVDESLENPDIYWFHMDEMMGFDAIWKYFGDPLDELKEELLQRDFIIMEDATLNAGITMYAIPALTSPYFYDNYLGEHLDAAAHLPKKERERYVNSMLKPYDVDWRKATDLELFRAFMEKGYNQVTIANLRSRVSLVPLGWYYTLSPEYNEERSLILGEDVDEDIFGGFLHRVADLVDLLCQTTPLARVRAPLMAFVRNDSLEWIAVPAHEDIVGQWTADTLGIDEERRLINRLYDSFSVPSPKLVYAINRIAHNPYDRIYKTGELENPWPDEPNNPERLYMPQYKYAARVMLNTIDMILEQNPDAIIVLQGDHGIHHRGRRWLVEQGYPTDQVNEINYSVLSAVRIPEAFGGLEEPVEPLNISRLLVNRYVGENYEMLGSDE